jgi:16S rRNA processing protein RimM
MSGSPVVMGRVLGAYGVHGWLRIEPFTERPDGLANYRSWWLKRGGDWREVAVAEAKPHGSLLVARLQETLTREQAAQLRGTEIGVPREAMPAPGENEVYEADLIGLRVVNREGQDLGTIEALVSNGAHPVLQVRAGDAERGGAERLLPYVASVVERVDLEARSVVVNWGVDW